MSVRDVEGSAQTGAAFLGALVGVTVLLAGVTTAIAPKRRCVPKPATPALLGFVLAVIGSIVVVGRAISTPGPPSAAPYIVRGPAVWLTVVASSVAAASLGAIWLQTRRQESQVEL